MKTKLSKHFAQFGVAMAIALLCSSPGWAVLQLEDRPTNATPPPPNMLFTPSVEYPTMVEKAHKDATYDPAKEYLGYFDPKKCYTYNSGQGYFEPDSFAGANHSCSSWSGNALNYATMAGMDTFRWALTGGSRFIDTASTTTSQGVTVLRRSYQSVNSTGKLSGRSIPSPSGDVTPNSVGNGETMKIGSTVYNVRVRVCDNRKGESYLENNCMAYKNPATGTITYKPVGLIQRYQSKIRYGAFSYLLNRKADGTALFKRSEESNIRPECKDTAGKFTTKNCGEHEIDGAVLRARLKNVGPLAWDNKTNINVEWDPATGVFKPNPDKDDADNSYGGKVDKSGVINYLNDYGFDSKNYQQYDQPSEMYAEALRYLTHQTPTPLYYERAASYPASKEGFPVITNWWKDDHRSVLSFCQKNAIVGIGDVNTHFEQNVDAGSGTFLEKAQAGMGSIYGSEGTNVAEQCWSGSGNPPACTNGGSNKIAGLAYYAHNNDLRPDLTAGKNKKVTVDTYWVDVLEEGSRGGGEYVDKNQYWLATKYGGMKEDGSWSKKNRKYTSKAGVTYTVPDNYFPASDPKAMVEGLEEIFAEVGVETPGTGAGAGWVSNNADGNVTDYYQTRYSPVDWSGSLEAYSFTSFDASDGSVKSTKLWDAASNSKINGQNWNTGRRIVTYARQLDGTYKGVPFRFEQLTTTQKMALGSDDPTRKAVLNHLRGDKTNEALPGYRERKTVLGDIVHSKPTEVGVPSAGYSDAKNPGYSKFKSDKASRTKVVYVGANDGMLHAIKGINGGADDGTELWAYIPSFLFEGPDNPKNPEVSGLRALTRSTYSHHYYVDATPMVRDVDFARTGGKLDSFGDGEATKPDWRTVLVSGLGKGGKGFFALDVTDPVASSENSVADEKVLWEFPRPEGADAEMQADMADMGFSFGRPLITKTKAWGWVVILTSGYNNDSGKGVLYVLNVKTGERLARVETGAGTTNEEAGFAQVSGYTQAYVDYTTDEVYGGDLLGNLWRFDLTGDSGSIPAPDKIAKFEDKNVKSQPVTAAPIIEIIEDASSPMNGTRWVAVGTGQWLSADDIIKWPGTQTQTMYVIRDGKSDLTEKITSGTTLHRGNLDQLSSPGAGLSSDPDRKGWFYDMQGNVGLSKERVTFPASFIPNTLVWTGIIPRGVQDECRIEIPDGHSRIYAVDLATGKTKLSHGSPGSNNEYYEKDSLAVGQEVALIGGEYSIVMMDSKGNPYTIKDRLGKPAAGGLSRKGVINWRTVE